MASTDTGGVLPPDQYPSMYPHQDTAHLAQQQPVEYVAQQPVEYAAQQQPVNYATQQQQQQYPVQYVAQQQYPVEHPAQQYALQSNPVTYIPQQQEQQQQQQVYQSYDIPSSEATAIAGSNGASNLSYEGILTPEHEKVQDTDGDHSNAPWDWDHDSANPYNWPKGKKWRQVLANASISFLASVATSVLSPAHADIMEKFHCTSTQAILPLSIYVFALGLGPIIGGPLSESIGRLPVLGVAAPLGMIFFIGCATCPESSLAGFCILRFLAGFALSPCLATTSGVLSETFKPVERGLPVAVFVLTPFLGPGMGPVFGAFSMRKGWRWTQWTLVFFGIFGVLAMALCARETYHPVLKRRRARQLGIQLPPDEASTRTVGEEVKLLLTKGLFRPVHMLVAEPIVCLSCLYIACEFATLFSFFAAVPYTFQITYGFGREDCGLVFLAIVVGCMLGLVTVMLCDIFIYRKRQVPRFPPHQVPPEHRLYAAMVGSIGLPLGLFWFGWTAEHHKHWAAPVVAIVPFAWGNICIFISLMQYFGDTYHGQVVASAASASSLSRYLLAGVFPLFTLQMYSKLGIGWASSLLGFIATALLPMPWLFFKFGPSIRARSKYV